jgi:uncharacterized membrane protein YgcG
LLLAFVAVCLVAAAIVLTAAGDYPEVALTAALAGLGALGAAFLLYLGARRSSGGTALMKALAVLLAMAATTAGVFTIGNAFESGRVVPMLIPLASLPFVISAFWWMAAPTREGRAVLDRIAGFRQYLEITEEDRLETMHPPEKTPELFERFLPYAVALKVENAWASRFTSVLAAAAASGNAQTMGWYSGHSDPWRDPDDFVDRVGDSLASGIASASTAPGSSSGSGGGGSSGGGGGGGGGSGW